MKKFSIKSLCVILSILTAIMSLPMTAFALDLSDNNTASEIVESSGDVLTAQKDIIEMTDMRTASVKYFRLEDGSYYAAQYDSAVHYQDENGDWQDIDNTLAVLGSEITTSNAKIKFAKKTTGNSSLFTLHDGNRKLTLSLDGTAKKIAGEITNYETEFGEDATKLQKMTTLDKINASVIYRDILPGVDLEYVVTGLNIKENIIVKERAENYSYSFTMQLNNLTATLNEKGEIIISESSSDEAVYIIPAPVMWDANNVTSDKATMSLTDHGNGKYTLVVTADSDWINAEKRAYPVTIDPPIYTDVDSDVLDLDFSQTSSSPFVTSTSLYVGNTWRAYWKLETLPSLPASAYIVDAQFALRCYTSTELSAYVGVYDVLTDWDDTINWSKMTATVSPQGKPAEHFTDFQYLFWDTEYVYGNIGAYKYWNVTPIVKGWYEGENYGLTLAPVSETTFTGTAYFRSNEYATASERPQLTIQYRDMKGIEDYWSFSSQSAGFAGSGSVNHANGNLVFSIPTLTTTDALMPITPSLVYNSNLSPNNYTYGNAQTAYTAAHGASGFKLSICETLIKKSYITEDGSTSYYYIWADGDGTEHYFMPSTTDTTTYVDEDGLLLTLAEKTASNTCTITDSGKNIRTFNKCSSYPSGTQAAYYLSHITDKNGNAVVFTVDSSYRPTAVQLIPNGSSTIEQLRIAYNTYGVPFAVWNPTSGDGVVFRYHSATDSTYYLQYVLRAHGGTTESQWSAFYNTNANVSTSTITVDAIATYTYDDTGLLTSATNGMTQYQINYSYDTARRVIGVFEYAGTDGQQFTLEYGTSSTIIRTSGSDDVFGSSDDLLTTYGFDAEGRTVSCYTTDLSRTQIYGASSGQYVGEDNDKAKNNLKSSVQTTQQSSNYLLNGGFDLGTSSLNCWSTSGNVTRGTWSAALAGNACALISASSITQTSSIYQYVYLNDGDYTLSAYVQTDDIFDIEVYLKVESLSDSTRTFIQRIPISEYDTSDSYIFAALDFASDPFYQDGTEGFKISVEVTGTPTVTKTVYVDNVMLSKTSGAAEFDSVQMGHFEDSSSGYEANDFWTILDHETEPITIADSGIPAFGDVLHIDIGLDEYQYIEQVVYEASDSLKTAYADERYTEAPMHFTLSGWAKGTGQNYASTSLFGIRVRISYSNGSSSQDFCFDKGITDWQFISAGFATNPSKGMVHKITLMIMYNDHAGEGYFDNISLVKDNSMTSFYTYMLNGYLSSQYNGRSSVSYTYDDNDNLETVSYSDGTLIEYIYDEYNRIEREEYGKASVLYSYDYTYNAYGQVTDTEIYDYSTGEVIYTCSTYNTSAGSHIFGTLASETNALDQTTRYFYDSATGELRAVAYPEGNGVAYSYDAIGNLTSVYPLSSSSSTGYIPNYGSAAIGYNYDSANRLSAITTRQGSGKNTTYRFTYDSFGNTTSISVGNYDLAEYNYVSDHDGDSYNGKLSSMTYGNGLTVGYTYDTLDRISQIRYNGTVRYSYTYNTDGALHSVTDHANGTVTVYKYDSEGKTIQSYIYDTATYDKLYSTEIFYDSDSRVSKIRQNYGYTYWDGLTNDDTSYVYNYNDTTGYLTGLTILSDHIRGNISSTFDNFGRADRKIVDFEVNGVQSFYNTLTYQYTENGNFVTGQVSQVTSEVRHRQTTGVVSTTTYDYTYDDNGNIVKIVGGNNYETRYVYDSLGQLIREDNTAKVSTYLYTYDYNGNLLSRTTYLLTEAGATPTYLQSTDTYTYGDTTWGDLLTAYNGTSITYDGVGNPLTIGSASLTWQGRQLMQYVNGSNTYAYTYNADGIRTSKTINGVTHEYVLNGTQIVMETVSDSTGELYTLVYLYDEAGAPIGMKYRTPTYSPNVFDCFFFEKNLQGDIVAVYDSNGTEIASYVYTAWGECTMTYYTSTSNSPGLKNPFKYRGYYHDTETNWYYLQSRYYNPTWGRFINADRQLNNYLLGYNLFAYCYNTPNTFIDPMGTSGEEATYFDSDDPLNLFPDNFKGGVGYSSGNGGYDFTQYRSAPTVDYSFAVRGSFSYGGLYNSRDVLSFYGGGSAYGVGSAYGACFIAGTLVETENGGVPIEEITIGTMVYAHNPDTGETALKPVVNTFVNETRELVHISVNGEEIITTPTHPFYVPQKGWTDAIQLRAGDRLQLLNGEYVVIEQVQHELLESPIAVYNFEVEDFHTYYVSSSTVLVHNSCNHTGRWTTERRWFWRTQATMVEVDKSYGAYVATENNIWRMQQGLAPIGWDNHSVQLHHWKGIAVDFYDYSPVSYTLHKAIHKYGR